MSLLPSHALVLLTEAWQASTAPGAEFEIEMGAHWHLRLRVAPHIITLPAQPLRRSRLPNVFRPPGLLVSIARNGSPCCAVQSLSILSQSCRTVVTDCEACFDLAFLVFQGFAIVSYRGQIRRCENTPS
jgi:hypothetical protein